MRLLLALRAFVRVLSDRTTAEHIGAFLEGAPQPSNAAEKAEPVRPPAAAVKAPARSEALTLLAALQREARFVDIVKEPLDNYTDAQVGAAARDVLRDCGSVLERLFALRPLVDQEEGSPLEVPAGYDPGQYRLTGNVQGEPPFQSTLVHHGWQATCCELPQWSGSKASAEVVAPLETEVK